MRIWTLDEANETLPRVQEIVGKARTLVEWARRDAPKPRHNGGVSTNGHSAARVEDEAAELQALLAELEGLGVMVRDPDRGLVDFPARTSSGRDYLLCWLDGEPTVAWWHWPEDGFAGRTPLTQPPE